LSTLTPTKSNGATTKASELVYVEPGRQVTDDDLAAMLPTAGVNVPFIADFLSAVLAHERCGRHLYRSVAGRTNNPVLRRAYEEFGEETERHATILEQLVMGLGGNPNYVSPAARAVEGTDSRLLESTYMLGGSLDVMTLEMAMLDAVLLAESADQANWATLARLADTLPDGDARNRLVEAVQQVAPEEDKHLDWARETKAKLVLLQADSRLLTQVGAKAEELVEAVRGWLS
jgi:rubrerythrin